MGPQLSGLRDVAGPGRIDALDPRLAFAPPEVTGGRFLARGGTSDVLEGSFPGPRVVIVEFPSLERAKAWFDSSEYQASRQKRLAVADLNLIVVEGV